MAMAKLRGPSALSPRQKGFAVAALAAMLAPAMIVGTKLVDWVNLSKHQNINVALGQADVYGALRFDPAELGASGRLPLSEELSAALIADLEDGDIDDDLDNDPGLIDDFPSEHGIPGVVLEAYLRAEDKMAELVPGCRLDWALLAGIGKVESNHANNGRVNAVGDATPKILGPVLNGSPGVAPIRDTDGGRLDGDTAWDRAVGPMQFIPATWASFSGDLNEDGIVNPNNIYDAALGAGRYLCAGGGDLTKQADRAKAVFRYNNSTTYVETVLKWAKQYSENVDTLPLLPDDGNNQQNPAPNNPQNPGTPPNNGNTPSNPPVSTPPSTPSGPQCPTPLPTPTSTSTTTPTTTTPSNPLCPPSSTPPSSTPPSSTPPSSTPPSSTPPSSNPPQTEPSTPPQSSSGTSQSSTNNSSSAGSSSVQPTSSSLITSTPS
ncbi:lytic transglycosylase domain-containing protein [Lentzea sp. NPDC054927]